MKVNVCNVVQMKIWNSTTSYHFPRGERTQSGIFSSYVSHATGPSRTTLDESMAYQWAEIDDTLGIDGYTKGNPLYLLSRLLSDYYGPD